MKCFWTGHKFGEIQKDGFQYCEKCNKAERPEEKLSSDKWKITIPEPEKTRSVVIHHTYQAEPYMLE